MKLKDLIDIYRNKLIRISIIIEDRLYINEYNVDEIPELYLNTKVLSISVSMSETKHYPLLEVELR